MPIILDKKHRQDTYQASADKDLFVFELRSSTAIPTDEILDFSVDDKIRLIDFNGDFSDLTFEVDRDADTITIGISGPSLSFAYVRDDRKVVLRNAADLIDENGNHLLTEKNFHLVSYWEYKYLNYLQESKLAVSEGDDVLVGLNSEAEDLHGREGDDILDGNHGDDILRGGKGHDFLDGGSGDDTLHGGKGDDYLNGSFDDDTLYGDTGDDTLDGNHGDDTLYGGTGDDTLYGGHGDDTLYGGKGDDYLNGSFDDDTLYGGRGSDTLDGSYGDDTLYGGRGSDTLDGSYGDDTLYGGKGSDTLKGDRGSDTFVFYERDGKDTIVDFVSPSPELMEAHARHFRAHLVGQGLSEDVIERYMAYFAERESSRALQNDDVIQLHLNVPADTSDEAAFEALTIRQDGDDTVIGYGSEGDTITLEGVSAISLGIEDFDFVFIG